MNKLNKQQLTKLIFYATLVTALVVIILCFGGQFWQSLQYNFGEKESIVSILTGLGNTLLITLFAFLLGVLLGVVVCLVQNSPSNSVVITIAKQIANIYVSIFRGTPAVVQLLISYFIIFKVSADYAIWVAILTFGLNSGAYVSEIIRGGITAVPNGQMLAGRSLGLSYNTVMKKIVLPQAIKNALPSLGNEFITLIKETSVVGFIGAFDLTLAFRKLANASYDYATVYLAMGIVYFLLVCGITNLFALLEKKVINHVK